MSLMINKVRIGFIGAGNIAQAHLKHIAKNSAAELVAICDIDQELVRKQAKKYEMHAFTDIDQMLTEVKLDAVFLCVPPFVRGNLEEKVVTKGIHLFAEKPIALNEEEAKEKVKIVKESNVIHASGYCLRYLDTVQKARKYLQDKKIAMVRGYYLSGFVETPWYRIKEKSGGQIVEQATHILDLMVYLAGDFAKVSADAALVTMKDIENLNIPDVTSANITFKSGAIGHLDSTFIQPDHRMGVEILGRNYRVEVNPSYLIIIDQKGKRSYPSTVNFLEEQDRLFIKAVQTKDPSFIYSSYVDGLKALLASLAVNQSYESERSVFLS